MSKSCAIIGGGIAGPATALALSKIGISCSIYELRDEPSPIGGAVNLTPNALRVLKDLNVAVSGCTVTSIEFWSQHTAKKLGEMPFRATDGRALRMLRKDLQQSLLAAVEQAGISITYGSRLNCMYEDTSASKITATFTNGKSVQADFVIGCDGLHSAVRSEYVEPDRKPIYTDAAGTYTTVDLSSIKSTVHFHDTALNMSRYGTILTTFIDSERTQIYLAAVMETKAQVPEAWRVQGSDHKAFLDEIHRRYDKSSIPCIPELINQFEDLYLYPIFKLSPEGLWSRGRVILLGDAAHAVSQADSIHAIDLIIFQMPPQGEAAGLALEDAVLLARVFQEFSNKTVSEIFPIYEGTRRPRITAAYKAANLRWENVKDKGWIKQKFFEWMFWGFLWVKGEGHQRNMAYDVYQEKLLQG